MLWPRAAFRPCLALAVSGFTWAPAFAAGSQTEASLSVAARRDEQAVHDVPGVESSDAELGVLQGKIQQKSQFGEVNLGIAASGEGGRSQTGDKRYFGGTVIPSLAYEGPRQIHHVSLQLTKSYDSQGMTRSSLREQLDAASLTADQKNRYTQAGVQTDHYVSLDPRYALVLFLSAQRLDREIDTRTYVGGGFVERQMSPLWKLRLGGNALQVVYDGEEIHASGPEVQSLHEWSESWHLVFKAGVKDYHQASGNSTAQNGGASLTYKRSDDRGTLGFERATGSKPVTAEVTTNDVSSVEGRIALARETAIEASVEQRLERWLSGVDEGSRAETLTTGMTFLVGWGGTASGLDERSRQNVLLSYQREDLRLKTGSKAARQVASLGFERVF